jgi:ribonuclease PH
MKSEYNIISPKEPLTARLHFLKHPDGSSELQRLYEEEQPTGADLQKKPNKRTVTSVWCSVNGPGDVQSSKRIFDRMAITFKHNRLQTKKAVKISDTSLMAVLRKCIDCTSYPRTALNIAIQEVQTESAPFSMVVNAVCLALMDASIAMRYTFCGVTVAHMDDSLIIEPDHLTMDKADVTFTFIFKPSLTEIGGSLIGFDCDGEYSIDTYKAALGAARPTALQIFDLYREHIQKKYAVGYNPH